MLSFAGRSCEGSTSDPAGSAAAGQDGAPGTVTDDRREDKRPHEIPVISGLLFINSQTGIESKVADAAGLLHLPTFFFSLTFFFFLFL